MLPSNQELALIRNNYITEIKQEELMFKNEIENEDEKLPTNDYKRRPIKQELNEEIEYDKKYKCLICEKSFSQKAHLNVHLVVHTGEKKYKCTVCDKTFSLKGNLKVHLAVHTGEKKYKCSICGKSFSSKSNLIKHLVIHTGEKKYKCSICEKSFLFKSKLNAHLAVHSKEVNPLVSNSYNIEIKQEQLIVKNEDEDEMSSTNEYKCFQIKQEINDETE